MSDAPSTPAIVLREGVARDAPALAQLMYDEIHWGRLRDFGIGFLTVLNRAFCTSRHAVCVVAESEGRIIGYIAGATNLGRFYRTFMFRYGLTAALAIFPRLFRENGIQTLLKGLRYHRDPRPEGPQSELLVFAVARTSSGQGVGRKLLDAIMAKLRAHGVDAVRMGTVSAGNDAALRLYTNYGFRMVDTHRFYADTQVHVLEYRFADSS